MREGADGDFRRAAARSTIMLPRLVPTACRADRGRHRICDMWKGLSRRVLPAGLPRAAAAGDARRHATPSRLAPWTGVNLG